MGRRALAGAVSVAALVPLALVALLGGGGGETTTTEPRSETTATATPASGGTEAVSQEEEAGISATLAAIDSGGPLPYEQDGDTFQNREGLLPQQPQGYYREYTVETPGSDDRGARRLVVGEAGETYFTRDHYQSFISIDPDEFR